MRYFDEIDSIDEAADLVDGVLEEETRKIEIPPEVEFWGHCSNLQAWYENDYDTRLIHSNLAFPLLQKLSEVGDPLAKEKFQKEVRKRYEKGTEKTKVYLREAGIINYLPLDEELNLLFDSENLIALTEFAEEVYSDRDPYKLILVLIYEDNVILRDKKVVELDFSGVDLELYEFPTSVLKLRSLEALDLGNNYFKEIPEDINKLKFLKILYLPGNEIVHIPDSLWEKKTLEKLILSDNHIVSVSEDIGNLENLKILDLGENQLIDLPESIGKLKNLISLNLGGNQLSNLPESIEKLKTLKGFSLNGNKIEKLPEFIEKLPSLEYLDVHGTPLIKNPEEIKKMVELSRKTAYSLRIRRK